MTEELTGQQPLPQGETVINPDVITTETAPITPEQDPKPAESGTNKDGSKWYMDVITGLRHNVRDTKQENETLKAEVAALKAGQKSDLPNLTDAEITRRASEMANVTRFNEKCNDIADKGKKELANFDGALANLTAVGALGANSNPTFLQAVTELPDAHKLLHHLGNNPDEAARINSLPPMKMAMELAKIEAQLNTPKIKPVSKAPAPITPVSGNGGNSGDLSDPDMSMAEFRRIRDKQREERNKR